MKNWKWFVYIIECSDNSYYTGMTWNPQIRYKQHLSKLGGQYTKQHGVKRLAYLEEHQDLQTARSREKQIKKRKINQWRLEERLVSSRLRSNNNS